MITLTIQGKDVTDALCTVTLMGEHITAAAETAFILWLKERGFAVDKAKDWETPKELCERLHLKPSFLSQALRHPKCPPALDASRGPTNRVRYIRTTPALDAFLTRHLKPKN